MTDTRPTADYVTDANRRVAGSADTQAVGSDRAVRISEQMQQVWPSGVGGVQCDECGVSTVVRATATDFLGVPTEWLCRACALGLPDDGEE